jgi:hypothetical protein
VPREEENYKLDEKVIITTGFGPVDWILVNGARLIPWGWDRMPMNFTKKDGAEMHIRADRHALEKPEVNIRVVTRVVQAKYT